MDNIVYSTKKVIYKNFILNDEDTQKVLEKAKEIEEEDFPNSCYEKTDYIAEAIEELLEEGCIEGDFINQNLSREELVAVRFYKRK